LRRVALASVTMFCARDGSGAPAAAAAAAERIMNWRREIFSLMAAILAAPKAAEDPSGPDLI
jgi:hypothetical protein